MTKPCRRLGDCTVFAVESLPGQYDQRADSCAQCIGILTCGERPLVSAAKVYALYGAITPEELQRIKEYVINPVESREATLDEPQTLCSSTVCHPHPGGHPRPALLQLDEEVRWLQLIRTSTDLAMDHRRPPLLPGLLHASEARRDPTITEIRRWSIPTGAQTTPSHATFLHPSSTRRRFGDEDVPKKSLCASITSCRRRGLRGAGQDPPHDLDGSWRTTGRQNT